LHFVTVYKCLFNKNLTIIIIIVELTNVLWQEYITRSI
jgi:hypothetical protein